MAKKLTEGEDQKESILSRITNLFKTQKTSKKEDPEADDDADAKKTDDEEADAKKEGDDEEMTKKEEDSTDPDEDDDDDSEDSEDSEDDDDSDEDEIEVNGKAVNLKDPAAARKAIEELQAINGQQNELLTEAAAELAIRDAKIAKTTEEVKKEIKSTFVPKSSKREKSIGTKSDEQTLPDSLMPAEGTIAYSAMKDAVARKKAEQKKR